MVCAHASLVLCVVFYSKYYYNGVERDGYVNDVNCSIARKGLLRGSTKWFVVWETINDVGYACTVNQVVSNVSEA